MANTIGRAVDTSRRESGARVDRSTRSEAFEHLARRVAGTRATGDDGSPAFPVPRAARRPPAAPRRKFLATSDPAASAPRVAGEGGGFIADRRAGGESPGGASPGGELSLATMDLAASREARAFLADSAAGVDGS